MTTGKPMRWLSMRVRWAMAAALTAVLALAGVSPTARAVDFVDVPADHPFYTEIQWLASTGVTTGWPMPDGTTEFRPSQPVARDAMAVFLYRYAGSPTFAPPAVSPFTDVPTSRNFYKEITWLASMGISTGFDAGGGLREFRPLASVERNAMAAFLYRYAGSPAFTPPATSPFLDIPTDRTFYKEITWLASTEITTGWEVDGGKEFRPVESVNRDAMAAFLYRYDTKGLPKLTDTTAPTITSTTPTNGATGVVVTSAPTAVASESLDPATVTTSTVTLTGPGGAAVAATVGFADWRTIRVTPSAPLAGVTAYTATVKGGASGVKDGSGIPLAADVSWGFTTGSAGPCDVPANSIVGENCLTGNPASEWEVSGVGDPYIQGFATDISVNHGSTVSFKISSPADYRVDIYRLGWYGGSGARKVATIPTNQTANLVQANCPWDSSTGTHDCGNWSVSASWAVPADATSGLYLARPVRTDTGGASHIPFIVRNDSSTADIVFQTSDTTWQAYNSWGGTSFYGGNGPGVGGSADGRAYKLSYNRPLNTRDVGGPANELGQDYIFNAEYPMIRWLERNGYDMSYISGVDTDRLGSANLKQHKTFLSVGHDEYWSGTQRANVESARNTGLNLAFFSGNEVYWKTRWENNYRTLVCYKETHSFPDNADPSSEWTGTWRDPRGGGAAPNGNYPENSLTGQLFGTNFIDPSEALEVPYAYRQNRIWRNTSVANLQPGQTATLAPQTLGYEFDLSPLDATAPSGLAHLSSTEFGSMPILIDYGSTFGEAPATHRLSLYRQGTTGGLVFGAGTIQWSWGLDGYHDKYKNSATSVVMQQATVNQLADMGAQPGTPMSGLVPAAASTDTLAPTVTIATPSAAAPDQRSAAGTADGAGISPGAVTVSGEAADAGGQVAGIEVSTDGGATWRAAQGTTTWTYTWVPEKTGPVTILVRGVDDSANLTSTPASVTLDVAAELAPATPTPVPSGTLPTKGA